MTGTEIVGYLIQLGIPGAVFAAVGYSVKAWRQRKKLIADAPDKQIDTSLARMQQATIETDKLIDNLRDVVDVQTQRAESAETRLAAAEARERALLARLADTDSPNS